MLFPIVKRWVAPLMVFATLTCIHSIESHAQNPTITSFTPLKGTVGTAVTISGSNFSTTAANNIVYFGATRASVTSATATRIITAVPYGATYSPIKVTVNGLSGYSPVFFTSTFQNIDQLDESSFEEKVNLNTTSDPLGLTIGDIDGDGKADIVSTNNNAGTVSVFRNKSTTTMITEASFASKVDFATGSGCASVAVEDFDNDGKLDIVTSNFGAGTISVLRNTSSSGIINASSFATKIDFSVGGTPTHVSAADIDRDGKVDIITSNDRGGLPGSVSVLRNLSTPGAINAGSFAAHVDFIVSNNPAGLTTADLNLDGKPEVIVANLNGFNISVLYNKSAKGVINSASLATKVDLPAGANPWRVSVGDLNNDGKPEIGVVTYGNVLRLYLNETTTGAITASSFDTFEEYKTSTNPVNLAMGDFTGDGHVDVAVTTQDANTVNLFMNNYQEDMAFSRMLKEGIQVPTGEGPRGVAIGDLNEDGKPEMIVTNSKENSLSVIRNAGLAPVIDGFSPAGANAGSQMKISGKFFSPELSENTVFVGNKSAVVLNAMPTELTVAAPQGVGNAPITVTVNELTASSNAGFHSTFVSTGIFSTSLTGYGPYDLGMAPQAIASADFDNDGLLDLCAVNKSDNTMSILKNVSDASTFMLAPRDNYTTGNSPANIKTADVDGDGRFDIVTAGGSTFSIFRNRSVTGEISFLPKFDFNVPGEQFTDVEIYDIDNDGKPEIILTSQTNNLLIFKNRAFGVINATSFSSKIQFPTSTNPLSVVARDMDGDGKPDIIVCNKDSHSVSVFQNASPRGALSANAINTRVDYAIDFSPSEVIIGDVDEDGKPDIVAANNYSHNISILKNKITNGLVSTSSFATRINFEAGPDSSPSSVVLEDFDGDGKVDIATTNNYSGMLAIFRNQFSGTLNESSFNDPVFFDAGFTPHAMVAGDFNNDSKPDIAYINLFENFLRVRLNTTDDIIRINTPPSVSYIQPDFSSSQVAVDVTGGTGEVVVMLRHRKITDEAFLGTPCTYDGNAYSVNILPEMLDELGVEYFFEATDYTGVTYSSPERSFIYKMVESNLIDPIPFGQMDGSFRTYQLFSIPYVLDDNNVSAAFSAFGQYDKTRWRMFNYSNGSYKEFNKEFFNLETGKGYWLTSKDNTKIKPGDGKVVEANQSKPFTFALERGWNQVGNPFLFNVDWQSVKDDAANGLLGLNSLFVFDAGAYHATDILQPWKGGFVFSENEGILSIAVTSKTLSGGRKRKADLPPEIDHDNWLLPIDVQLQGLRSTAAVGMHPKANFSKDNYDEIAIPHFTEYLQVSTYHPEYFGPDFSYDVVPTEADHYWDINVGSSIVNGMVKISWDQGSIRDAISTLILMDLTDMSVIDMKKTDSYSFRYNGERTVRILFSRDEVFDHGLSGMGSAYPNPFRDVVSIPVFYPRGEQQAEILIYDLSGKPVATIRSTNDTGGISLAKWYGRNRNGEMCPNGMYLYCLRDEKGNISKMKKMVKNF